jgi:hypothetical protein
MFVCDLVRVNFKRMNCFFSSDRGVEKIGYKPRGSLFAGWLGLISKEQIAFSPSTPWTPGVLTWMFVCDLVRVNFKRMNCFFSSDRGVEKIGYKPRGSLFAGWLGLISKERSAFSLQTPGVFTWVFVCGWLGLISKERIAFSLQTPGVKQIK